MYAWSCNCGKANLLYLRECRRCGEPATSEKVAGKEAVGALSVVIPTYCEEENIGRLLEKLLALECVSRVIVVDDNSPDRTGAIVAGWARRDARVRLLTRVTDRGYGRSLRDGMAALLQEGAEAVATIDCDLSHDPAQLPAMLERLAAADLVIGSRYVAGGRVLGWPWYRHLLSRTANAFVRWYLHLEIRDCTSGYRVYRARVIREIGPDGYLSEGYSLLPELARRIVDCGGRVDEYPITFTDREAGKSKMGPRQVLRGLQHLMLLRRDEAEARSPVPAK